MREHKYRVEVVKRPLSRWFWQLRDAQNGNVLASSETFTRRIDALDTATQLAEALGTMVYVVTKGRRRTDG